MLGRNALALVHAVRPVHKRRVREANDIVQRALDMCERPTLSLSGGKDSTVLMHIVRRYMPDIPAIWSDDEFWLPETDAYMKRVTESGVNLHQIQTNAWHADWFELSGNDWDSIDHYVVQKLQCDMQFWGLRKEESAARRVNLCRRGMIYRHEKQGTWVCNPLANWTWRDIWAYILFNKIDYNRAYDKLEDAGIPPERQRLGPYAVQRVLNKGQLSLLKRLWPDEFARFAEKYPEANNYV